MDYKKEEIKRSTFSKRNEMRTTKSYKGILKKLDILEKRRSMLKDIYSRKNSVSKK